MQVRFVLIAAVVAINVFATGALAIEIDFHLARNSERPSFDRDNSEPLRIFEAAGALWEDLILDDHTIDITIGYQDATQSDVVGWAVVHNDFLGKANSGAIGIDTRNNAGIRNYYFDPTPDIHDEFDMHQILVRDLATPARELYFDGNPPELMETGYWGNARASAPEDARQGIDLLTIAAHEIGHILGLGENLSTFNVETNDLLYNIEPNLIAGNDAALKVYSEGRVAQRDHLRSSDSLMAAGEARNGDRNLPSAADVFAAAAVANWQQIDLKRRDFLRGSSWYRAGNWEGHSVPNGDDEVFVRHGGQVSLDLDRKATAASLLVSEGSSVVIREGFLDVGGFVTIEGARSDRSSIQIVNETETSDSVNTGYIADATLIKPYGSLAQMGAVDDGQFPLYRVSSDLVNVSKNGAWTGSGRARLDFLSNDGAITAISPPRPSTRQSSLLIRQQSDLGRLDLDGSSESGDLFAVLGSLRFEGELADPFNGKVSIGAGRSVTFPAVDADAGPSRVQGRVSFEPSNLGIARVPASLWQVGIFDGANIGVETSARIESKKMVLENGVSIALQKDANLTIAGNVDSTGTKVSGAGSIRFVDDAGGSQAHVRLMGNNTFQASLVDLDGADTNADNRVQFEHAQILTDRLDTDENRFDGVLRSAGGHSTLHVQLPGDDRWEITNRLEAYGGDDPNHVMFTGSDIEVSGTMAIAGEVRSAANLIVSGTLDDMATAQSQFTLRLDGRDNRFLSSAILNGNDTVEVTDQGRLLLGPSLSMSYELRNHGDLVVPPTFVHVGDYHQSATGEVEMNIAGSWSQIIADDAQVDGDLRMQQVFPEDPKVPGSRQVFTVLGGDSLDGGFATLHHNDVLQTPDFFEADGRSFRSHAGGGLFRGLAYSRDDVAFTNYLAATGDSNGDGSFNIFDIAQVLARGEFEDGIAGNSDWLDGDWNHDNEFDRNDLLLILSADSTATPLVCDGSKVLSKLLNAANVPLGDANLDGKVAFGDFLQVANDFGSPGNFGKSDMSCDGQVKFDDFSVVAGEFGRSSVAAHAVPEPSAQVFCLFIGCCLLGLRRKIARYQ